jgi:hypothetical protein
VRGLIFNLHLGLLQEAQTIHGCEKRGEAQLGAAGSGLDSGMVDAPELVWQTTIAACLPNRWR